MLFVAALLLVSTLFLSLLKKLTGFTIVHPVTLTLSALEVIDIKPCLVEIVVALSIIKWG